MAVNPAPSATATPPAGAPAAGGTRAETSAAPELASFEEALLADLAGESGLEAGAADQDPVQGGNPTGNDPADGDDAASSEDGEETTDTDETDAEGSGDEAEDETDEDNAGDPDETGTGDEEAENNNAGGKAAAGMPAAIAQALKEAKLPHGLFKRINKAFQHSRTYREEAERLRGELASTPEPITLTPTAQHPLSDVQTVEELDQRRQAAEEWLDWCAENPDGGTAGKTELTAEEVKEQRRWATQVLKALPARQQWLGQRQQYRTQARAALPEMFVKDSPEYKAAQALVKGTPELVHQPDYEVSLADMVRGLKYRVLEGKGYTVALVPPSKKKASASPPDSKTAAAAAPGNRTATPKPPARPAATPHSKPTPTPHAGSKPSIDALHAKAAASGSEADVDRLLAAELAG